ncbi:unnamed protein product [Arabidopsis thaliana]|uniref:Uncharacterized protein n=1 Tax=Arabidopsis thaliana TaxID=3702 RepID=A0A5S9XQF1_ARATH|nr:unnamed protein product [Arabidopsis thaliana]
MGKDGKSRACHGDVCPAIRGTDMGRTPHTRCLAAQVINLGAEVGWVLEPKLLGWWSDTHRHQSPRHHPRQLSLVGVTAVRTKGSRQCSLADLGRDINRAHFA